MFKPVNPMFPLAVRLLGNELLVGLFEDGVRVGLTWFPLVAARILAARCRIVLANSELTDAEISRSSFTAYSPRSRFVGDMPRRWLGRRALSLLLHLQLGFIIGNVLYLHRSAQWLLERSIYRRNPSSARWLSVIHRDRFE